MNEKVEKLNALRREREEKRKEKAKRVIANTVKRTLRARKRKRRNRAVKSVVELKEMKKEERLAKKRRKIVNRRYYEKRVKEKLKKMREEGDRMGYFFLVVMRNRKLHKKMGTCRHFTKANVMFDDLVLQNSMDVLFPVKIKKHNNRKVNLKVPVKYEILLLERCKNGVFPPSYIQDDNGKYIEVNVRTGGVPCRVLRHSDWLIEETFHVQGYHPTKDRKDCGFILNEIILKDAGPDDIKFIYYKKKKLFILHNDDFEIVFTKSNEECRRLFDTLKDLVGENQYVVFVGLCDKEFNQWVVENAVEKTGRRDWVFS